VDRLFASLSGRYSSSRQAHFGLAEGAFESAAEARSLLAQCVSFSRAKVPVRFGHNTDASLQWAFGAELYRLLPPTHPLIMMTRFPLAPRQALLFQGQPNLLCKLSVPPRSTTLDTRTDPFQALHSVINVPRENLYVLIGPVAADGLDEARALMAKLPPGTWCDVKPLTRSGINTVVSTPIPSAEAMADLRTEGRARGLMVTDYFGCQLRRRLGRSFYKASSAPPYVRDTCRQCEGQPRCFPHRSLDTPVVATEAFDHIRKEAAAVGLPLGQATSLGPAKTSFQCEVPASRGDETYSRPVES
jgi:hypothetical protein